MYIIRLLATHCAATRSRSVGSCGVTCEASRTTWPRGVSIVCYRIS